MITSKDQLDEMYRDLACRLEYRDGKLYWIKAWKRSLIGAEAGKKDKNGYVRIHAYKFGRMLSAHRVIYYMHYGKIPEFIDHIDGNPLNNEISNLRAATREQNARNCKTNSRNTSGRKGVYWHDQCNKWQVSIRHNGKLHYLGLFVDFDSAVSARKAAEDKYHGEFSRGGE